MCIKEVEFGILEGSRVRPDWELAIGSEDRELESLFRWINLNLLTWPSVCEKQLLF